MKINVDKIRLMWYNVFESEIEIMKKKTCYLCVTPNKLTKIVITDKYGVRNIKVCKSCNDKYLKG